MLVVALAVASPVLVGMVAPSIPQALWVVLLACFLAACIGAVLELPGSLALVCLASAVGLSWVLVLTTPGMGLLNVLLVVTVALSAYLVPVRAGFVIIAANTVLLAVAAVASGQVLGEVLLVVGFYVLIQAATLWSTHALAREQRLRLELTTAHVELRAAASVLAVNERASERLRISRDLHDVLGHQLTVLALELEAARHRVEGPGAEHVERAQTVAKELLAKLRATVDQLRTGPAGFRAALEAIVIGLPGLVVHLDVQDGIELDEQRSEALLLTVREAVTNTLRHAEATMMWINIERHGSEGEVSLTIEDDGVGAVGAATGNGLKGVAERIAALGGMVESGHASGSRGFRLRAWVPGP